MIKLWMSKKMFVQSASLRGRSTGFLLEALRVVVMWIERHTLLSIMVVVISMVALVMGDMMNGGIRVKNWLDGLI